MYTEIESDQWDRREIFRFFQPFANPCTAVTASVHCTGLKQIAKERGESLFIYHLYCCLKAQNEIEPFRVRLLSDGRIVLFNSIGVSTMIDSDGCGRLVELCLPWITEFSEFYHLATSQIEKITAETNYHEFGWRDDSERMIGTVAINSLPQLSFTSIQTADGLNVLPYCPLITLGKVSISGDNETMPVAITSHHGLVDGSHITAFFHQLERNIPLLTDQLNDKE